MPSGQVIRALSPPYLLGTKLEAFNGRGRDDDGELDYLDSRDFGDIVVLVDGRAEVVDEVLASAAPLRRYLAEEFGRLAEDPRFESGVAAHLRPDVPSQARRGLVLERIRRFTH